MSQVADILGDPHSWEKPEVCELIGRVNGPEEEASHICEDGCFCELNNEAGPFGDGVQEPEAYDDDGMQRMRDWWETMEEYGGEG